MANERNAASAKLKKEEESLIRKIKRLAKSYDNQNTFLSDLEKKLEETDKNNKVLCDAFIKNIQETEKSLEDISKQKQEADARLKQVYETLKDVTDVAKQVTSEIKDREVHKKVEKKRQEFNKVLDKLNEEIVKSLPASEAAYEALAIQFEKERDAFERQNQNLSGYYKQSKRVVNEVINSSKNDQTIKNLRFNLKMLKEQRQIVESTYDKGVERDEVIKELKLAEGAVNKTLEKKTRVLDRSLNFVKQQEGNILAIVSGVLAKSPILMWGISALDDMMKGLDEEQTKQTKIKSELLEQHRNVAGRKSGGRLQVSSKESGEGYGGDSGILYELKKHTRILNRLLGVDENIAETEDEATKTQRRKQESQEAAAEETSLESGLKVETSPNAKPESQRKKAKSGGFLKSLGGLVDVFLLGKFSGIFAGIKKLVGGLFTKIKVFTKTLPRLLGLVGGVLTAIYNVVDSYTSARRWGVDKIEAMISSQLIPAFGAMLGGPIGFLVGELIQMAMPESWRTKLAGLTQEASDGLKVIFSLLEVTFKWIVNLLDRFGTKIGDIYDDSTQGITWLFYKTQEKMADTISSVQGKLGRPEAAERMKKKAEKIREKLKGQSNKKQVEMNRRTERDTMESETYQNFVTPAFKNIESVYANRAQKERRSKQIVAEGARAPEWIAYPATSRNQTFLDKIGFDGGGGMPQGATGARQQLSTGGTAMASAAPQQLSPGKQIAGGKFIEKAPQVMSRLQQDLGISKEDAAAIVGNLGHESAGMNPSIVNPSSGAYGWAQWLGSRKKDFFAFAAAKGLDPKSDEANYQFLVNELKPKGSEHGALKRLMAAQGLENKTVTFERAFERSGAHEKMDDRRIANTHAAMKAAAGQGSGIPAQQASLPGAAQRNIQSMAGLDSSNFLKLWGLDQYSATQFASVPKSSSEYAAANTANSNAKLGAAVGAGAPRGTGGGAGKAAVAGGRSKAPGGGGGTGAGRGAARGNEPALQAAINTDFSGSSA